MRISDWSSDVCSSDLDVGVAAQLSLNIFQAEQKFLDLTDVEPLRIMGRVVLKRRDLLLSQREIKAIVQVAIVGRNTIIFAQVLNTRHLLTRDERFEKLFAVARSEEHTSELQSLMRISYAVFCLKKKNK